MWHIVQFGQYIIKTSVNSNAFTILPKAIACPVARHTGGRKKLSITFKAVIYKTTVKQLYSLVVFSRNSSNTNWEHNYGDSAQETNSCGLITSFLSTLAIKSKYYFSASLQLQFYAHNCSCCPISVNVNFKANFCRKRLYYRNIVILGYTIFYRWA